VFCNRTYLYSLCVLNLKCAAFHTRIFIACILQAVTNFGIGSISEQQDGSGDDLIDISTSSSSSPASSMVSGNETANSAVTSLPIGMQLQQSQQIRHGPSTASSAAASVTSNSSTWASYAAGSAQSASAVPVTSWSCTAVGAAQQQPCISRPDLHQHSSSVYNACCSLLDPSTQRTARSCDRADDAAVYSVYAPECNWALPMSVCSSAVCSYGSDDIVSQAANTMSEVSLTHNSACCLSCFCMSHSLTQVSFSAGCSCDSRRIE